MSSTSSRSDEPFATGARLVDLPRIMDARGNLTFVESSQHVPFAIRRAYWIYGVPGGESRGGHGYRRLEEFFIALSGSFRVTIDDGAKTDEVVLNRSYFGLYVPALRWRRLDDFSTNAVCLILASLPFSEDDYVRDREAFLAEARP